MAVDDSPGGGIFYRYDAIVGPAPLHFGEYILNAFHGHVLGGQSELLHPRHVRKGRARTEVGDLQGTFQGQGGRKDLAVHCPKGILRKRAFVPAGQTFEDLPLSAGRMEIELFSLFDITDLNDDLRALVQKVDQFIVDLIDLFAKLLDLLHRHGP